MLKVMAIFGTRPEAVKMCPLVLELKKKGWDPVCGVSYRTTQGDAMAGDGGVPGQGKL